MRISIPINPLRIQPIGLVFCLSLLSAGTAWTAGLPEFPKPDPAGAFGELKIFSTNGSPVRLPVEDWAGAKQRADSDPEWRDWVDQHGRRLEDWMIKCRDQVGWIAGWHHDFVSPKDGSFLTFTADEPKETLSSPSDSKVELTPKLRAAWVYEFRIRNADMMVEAARLFRLTGNRRYAQWAADQLNFYTDNYNHWTTTAKGTHFMYQSLDEAVILTRWIAAARTLGDFVAEKQRERWSQSLFEPEARLLNASMQSIHNIACWQRSATGQAALYCHDDALWRAAVEGPYGIRSQLQRGVTGDYLWVEQSLGYNAYVVKALAPFFEYALMQGKGADLETEMEITEDLLLSPLTMRFPNGQLPNPADAGKPQRLSVVSPDDAESGEASFSSETLADLWRLYPTKPGLALLEKAKTKNWESLLDPPPVTPPVTPLVAGLPPVTSRNLESSRMAVIRGGPWQVFFHYGQLTGTHSQAEALNYEVFYRDIDVSHDPGTTGYGSKFTTEFFRSGLCHNVPLVDGVGEDSWHRGKLDCFSRTNVIASQPEYQPNASVQRSLTIVGDELRDCVSLATSDGKTHRLGFVLNLQGRVKLPEGFKKDSGFPRNHDAVAFNYWKNVQFMTVTNQAGFNVEFKGMTIEIQFHLPGQFTVYHALAPDYPPAQREVLYIETRGQESSLTTIFSNRADAHHNSKEAPDRTGKPRDRQ